MIAVEPGMSQAIPCQKPKEFLSKASDVASRHSPIQPVAYERPNPKVWSGGHFSVDGTGEAFSCSGDLLFGLTGVYHVAVWLIFFLVTT